MRAIRAFFDSRGMPPAYPSHADERGKPMETSQSAKTAKIHRKKRQKISKKQQEISERPTKTNETRRTSTE